MKSLCYGCKYAYWIAHATWNPWTGEIATLPQVQCHADGTITLVEKIVTSCKKRESEADD